MGEATAMSGGKLDALTGLRLFAAVAIVLHHLGGRLGVDGGLTAGWSLGQGVSVFFVLSGFVLTYRYPVLADGAAVRRFWVARIARIWPAHAVILLLLLAVGYDVMPAIDSTRLPHALANLALVQSWFPYAGYFFGYNSVSWSISTEMGFYALFPLLIAAFGRTWLWKLVLAFVLGIAAVAIAHRYQVAPFQYPAGGVVMEGLIYVNPLARLFEFVLGMCTALLWGRHHARVRLSPAGWLVAEAAVLALVLFNVSIASRLFGPAAAALGTPGNYWLVMSLAPSLPTALLLLVMASSRGPVARLLAARPLVYLGEVSFAIYLTHLLLLTEFDRLRAAGILPAWVALVAALVAILVAASAMHHFVERPGKRLILSLHRRIEGRLAPPNSRDFAPAEFRD